MFLCVRFSCYIPFSSFTFPDVTYWIFLLYCSQIFLSILSRCHQTTTSQGSPPNSIPRRFLSYLLLTLFLYLFFIFYLPSCILPVFPSVSSLTSLPFLSCWHRTTPLTLVRVNLTRFPFKLNSTMVTNLPSLIFPFNLLPSPVHATGFSFCFFPGFLVIFILLSLNLTFKVVPIISSHDILFYFIKT